MGTLMSLKDGSVENITDPKDFSDLVEERLGYEAAEYMKGNFYTADEDPINFIEDVYWTLTDIGNCIQYKKMENIEVLKLIVSLRSKIGRRLDEFYMEELI